MIKNIYEHGNQTGVMPDFIEQCNYENHVRFYVWWCFPKGITDSTVCIWKIKPKTSKP